MESCLFSQNLIQNSSISISAVNPSKKRKIEDIEIETNNNDGKYCIQYFGYLNCY